MVYEKIMVNAYQKEKVRPLKALLWDMDGTLVDSEPAHRKALERAMRFLGKTAPADIHDQLLGCSYVEVHRTIVEITRLDISLGEWNELKWKYYLACSDEIKLLRNRQNILNLLLQRGIPMALVSNSTRDEVNLNLTSTNLTNYFEATISRNDVTLGKPSPEGYLLAASALSISPENCLVIEDSITGANSGLAAGMMTVFHPESDYLNAYCPEGATLLKPCEDLFECVQKYF